MTVPGSANILIVDDQPRNARWVEKALGQLQQRIVAAGSGAEALQHAATEEFAVILLDVVMPGMDGYETAARLRQQERSRYTPIVYLTATQPAEDEVLKGYDLGAVDYLIKPLLPEILRSKVAVFVELFLKREEVKRQGELLLEAERQEVRRKLAEERFAWEARRLAEDVRKERQLAGEMARRNEELALAIRYCEETEGRLRESEGRLRVLSRQLLKAQEAERRRLVCELHDEIGQLFGALKLELYNLQRIPPEQVPAQLAECVALVDRATQQVRQLSVDLRPPMLDEFGLVPAVRWYLERLGQRAGFSGQLAVADGFGRLGPELEITCFRIIQESLTNVIRYAGARTVGVELRRDGPELLLAVRDDGAGFDVGAAHERSLHRGSIGLLGMQERAQLVGGQLEVESAVGRGTTIRARFPLAPAEVPAAAAAKEEGMA
ncbi:MAG TPA: response regulator [Gemmataceae bacterium]|nr:response regulator [Gemmataceae bacterium]